MANCAQLINCLNSLYLAHEDKFCVTPVGHVFKMYAAHQGGQSLRTVFSGPSIHYERDGKPASFGSLKGSASLHEKQLILTVVNTHVSEPREAEIAVRGASVQSASATVLTSSDIHAHNTFAEPDAIVPKDQPMANGPLSKFIFPPASVTKLVIALS
jgi:alpha-L-arabinofuranosidase